MRTVLVVDDEPEIRNSLRGILADEGLTVLEAADGRAAIEMLHRHRPDLVLLDIWMPEVDGIEVLQRLREEGTRVPVVMISGHGNVEAAVRATKLGAFDFIEKPLSLEAVLAAVHRALGGHEGVEATASAPAPAPARAAAAAGGRPQKTIRRSVVASGRGLHSGIKSGLILHPAPPDHGIVFANLSTGATVPARVDFVESTGYATTLHRQGVTAATVEHLLAALHAYGITNLLVKMQTEVPVMDGSAAEFCRLLEEAGVEEQDGVVEEIRIPRALRSGETAPDRKGMTVEPCERLEVHYTLRYPPPVGVQEYHYVHEGPESFRREIAPARTFGFVRDMKAMATMGLAGGGHLDNCILIDDEKIVNTELRFPEELARHKILDLLGDFYLLGRPIRGRISARMTGHSDNIAMVRALRAALGEA